MSEWIRMLQVRGYNSNIRFGKFLLYEYIVPDNYNIKNILYIHRIFQKCTQIAGEILTQNMGEPPKPLLRTSREHICSKQWSRISTQNMFWNSKTNVLSICPALQRGTIPRINTNLAASTVLVVLSLTVYGCCGDKAIIKIIKVGMPIKMEYELPSGNQTWQWNIHHLHIYIYIS